MPSFRCPWSFQPAGAVPFHSVVIGSGIVASITFFKVLAGGVYEVTVDLQGTSLMQNAQLTVNGVPSPPSLSLNCATLPGDCTFTRLLTVAAGGMISLVNAGNVLATVDIGSGITIVRIA
jgi:hypothetical protein